MTTDSIPESVLVALEAVRASGEYNMMERIAVINWIAAQEEENWDTWGGASNWLYDNPNRYMEALRAMGARRAKP
jgi:hypothetical protein